MKQWNKDDLILFYYGELNHDENREVRNALASSGELQQEYAELCDFLDNNARMEVPPAESNLNQRIMAGVFQEAEKQAAHKEKKVNEKSTSDTIGWLSLGNWPKLAGISFALSFVVISIFFLGRWSSPNKQPISIAETPINSMEKREFFSAEESRRVLLNNVSSHFEIGGRLFTLVSNGNGEVSEQLEARKETIEELVALNRLYRRIAEKTGDKQLANLLHQMESILIEINNTDASSASSDIDYLKERLDNSDLIYRLKVTNKKIDQKLI